MLQMHTPLFVTGTDTGVGKTHVACTLIHALRARGWRVVGMKPVASGCANTAEGWRNADALALQAASLPTPFYPDVNPYPLPVASAPQLAAREAGIVVALDAVQAAFGRLASCADRVVVEGVGGWATPLADGMEHAHLAHRLQAGVILVVGLRLGCLNHARLSARAIISDGCHLRGWIGNQNQPDFAPMQAYLDLLRAALPAPCLGVIPYGGDLDREPTALLDMDAIEQA